MSKAPQNLNKILAKLRKAVKLLDIKIMDATKIKNLSSDALTEIHRLDIVNKANLSTNLYLMRNIIISLETKRTQMRQQILQIIAIYQKQRNEEKV